MWPHKVLFNQIECQEKNVLSFMGQASQPAQVLDKLRSQSELKIIFFLLTGFSPNHPRHPEDFPPAVWHHRVIPPLA